MSNRFCGCICIFLYEIKRFVLYIDIRSFKFQELYSLPVAKFIHGSWHVSGSARTVVQVTVVLWQKIDIVKDKALIIVHLKRLTETYVHQHSPVELATAVSLEDSIQPRRLKQPSWYNSHFFFEWSIKIYFLKLWCAYWATVTNRVFVFSSIYFKGNVPTDYLRLYFCYLCLYLIYFLRGVEGARYRKYM